MITTHITPRTVADIRARYRRHSQLPWMPHGYAPPVGATVYSATADIGVLLDEVDRLTQLADGLAGELRRVGTAMVASAPQLLAASQAASRGLRAALAAGFDAEANRREGQRA